MICSATAGAEDGPPTLLSGVGIVSPKREHGPISVLVAAPNLLSTALCALLNSSGEFCASPVAIPCRSFPVAPGVLLIAAGDGGTDTGQSGDFVLSSFIQARVNDPDGDSDAYPHPATMLLTLGDPSPGLFRLALQNNISAFSDIHDGLDFLCNAIRIASQGGFTCSPRLVGKLRQASSGDGGEFPKRPRGRKGGRTAGAISLTAREEEIALLIARHGYSDQEIARHLHVSVSTIKTHLTDIYRKLSIRGRSQIHIALGLPERSA